MSKHTQLADLDAQHNKAHNQEMACRAKFQDLFEAEAAGELSQGEFDSQVEKLDRKIEEAIALKDKLRGPIHQLRSEIHADPEGARREHDFEVVRVRGINVHALSEAFLDPDMFEDHEPATDGLGLTCGCSWIQGPRLLLLCYLWGAQECSRDNLMESFQIDGFGWSEDTPQWMVEQNLQRKIDAVYRAIEKATLQL